MGAAVIPALVVDIALVFGGAILFGYLAHKLGQPTILGYLVAGLLIGPYTFDSILAAMDWQIHLPFLITEVEQVLALSEIGVTLLLFMVGLEFSIAKLKKTWKVGTFGGLLEMSTLGTGGFLAGFFILGLGFKESLFVGFILMISSTIIVFKTLREEKQMNTVHGEIATGILVMEDIVAVILVTISVTLAAGAGAGLFDIAKPVVAGGLFVGLMLVFGRFWLPLILRKVAETKSSELFLATAFGVVLLVAWMASLVGLSVTLGAFIAGFVLGESEYQIEILHKLSPLKDLFLILFFVGLGMNIDPTGLLSWQMPLLILLLTVILMTGKFLAISVGAMMVGYHPKSAIAAGMSMTQIGEFSFIIATIGFTGGVLSSTMFSAIIGTAVVTMIFTPYLVRHSTQVGETIGRLGFLTRLAHRQSRMQSRWEKARGWEMLNGHVIVVGYTKETERTVQRLVSKNTPVIVIEYDPIKVAELQEHGIRTIFGDAINPEVLLQASAQRASVVVIGMIEPHDAIRTVQLIREQNHKIKVLVCVRREADWTDHRDLVDHIIQPETAGSEVVAEWVMGRVPEYIAQSKADKGPRAEKPRVKAPPAEPAPARSGWVRAR